MAITRNETVHGYLIHHRPVGEHRYLAWLFTAEQGLVRTLATGQVPEKARLAEWSLRTREQESRLRDFRFTAPRLVQTQAACFLTLYVHELLFRLAPVGIGETTLFQSFSACLVHLNYPDRQVLALRTFEAELLRALGQGIDYRFDVQQRPIQFDQRYEFHAQQGFDQSGQGLYTGQQVLAAGRAETALEGVLSLLRQCHAQQLTSLLTTQPIYSRHWPKRLNKEPIG
ncbi:DNA repair protein RecO C-terminal domain-containing protein [Reinekea blandensis]|uniref:DNA repair protein n=1 Tax=Reinekea blandensis MED297 TaxID=314283 RepID=A4BBK0_9GAMM|nr:DNA repair protein RecO C-terminal domain-containing protein [Reinekea blandensis]EAR10335.1 DNA repair protein [Reinekea sp. MED297] [Reinekea blandensis MED297]